MAREIITKVWCDVCQTEDPENPVNTEAEETPPVTIGMLRPRVIALCETHKKERFDPFDELVRMYGQNAAEVAALTPTTPKRGGGRPPGKRTGPWKGEYACPDPACPKHDKPYSSMTSLRQHTDSHHGKTPVEMRLEFDPDADFGEKPEITRTECEDCDQVYEWPEIRLPMQAMGVHRARMHGKKAANSH
jgi:hypothetical protein